MVTKLLSKKPLRKIKREPTNQGKGYYKKNPPRGKRSKGQKHAQKVGLMGWRTGKGEKKKGWMKEEKQVGGETQKEENLLAKRKKASDEHQPGGKTLQDGRIKDWPREANAGKPSPERGFVGTLAHSAKGKGSQQGS